MIIDYYWDSDFSIRALISNLILENKVTPVLGSGFTRNCKSKDGRVPSGDDMSDYLRQFAANAYKKDIAEYKNTTFTELCSYYNKRSTTIERFNYFSKNFTEVELSQDKIDFLSLLPQYMYTLNIDDGIEHNCNEYKIILPRRNIFEEYIKQYSTVFKVHGDVHHYLNNIEEEELIFNKRQYIDSIKSNAKMLSKLKDDFSNSNLLYVGCSLSDEPDLMSVVIDAVKTRRAECQAFYITGSVLEDDKRDLLEDYGITACLIVNDYEKFYKDLVSDVQRLESHFQPINIYKEPEIIALSRDETSLDNILNSNSIVPVPFEGKIYKPPFVIERDMIEDVIRQLREHSPIHIIYGHRISGKTFCLFNLFEMIKDKRRYFFSSGTKISNSELEKLFENNNCLFIFDTNSLDSEQMFKITREKKKLSVNANYVIIAVNSSDRNGLDLMTENMFYGSSKVKNAFSDSELIKLNKNLQLNNLPTFLNCENFYSKYKKKYMFTQRTILDNLYMIAEKFSSDTRIFDLSNIAKFSSVKDLALFILLATEQTLSGYDLFYFNVQNESEKLVKELPIHFAINYYQYNLSRIDSNYKLTTNSRYFLLRYLGEYAKSVDNYENILMAYRYIFQQISNAESEFDCPRKMLDFIKFDVLNDVFYRNNNSVIELIKYIYEGMENDMNINPQFKHQRAKSIFWLCPNNSLEIKDAVRYVDLARHDVEVILKHKFNKKLKISLEHIKYTQASIYGRLCALNNYREEEITIKTLQYYKEALSSDENYGNREDLVRKKTEKYIYEDLQGLLNYFVSKNPADSALALETKQLANELEITLKESNI